MLNLVALGFMARYRGFLKFSLSSNKTCEPKSGAKFDPRAIIWALSVEAHYIMRHVKVVTPPPTVGHLMRGL